MKNYRNRFRKRDCLKRFDSALFFLDSFFFAPILTENLKNGMVRLEKIQVKRMKDLARVGKVW